MWDILGEGESSVDHWQFFIIFSKISIEFIIINIVEQSDQLLELLSVLSYSNVLEVLNIQGNGTNLRSVVTLLDFDTRLLELRSIFSNESDNAILIVNLFLGQNSGARWILLLRWGTYTE